MSLFCVIFLILVLVAILLSAEYIFLNFQGLICTVNNLAGFFIKNILFALWQIVICWMIHCEQKCHR
jgi:hypothetical protein